MNDPKRQEIKDRIAASQARNDAREQSVMERAGESAIEAKDSFTAFAKEHPLATVAGGLALGVLIAGMFPSARHAARKSGTRAAALSAVGAEAVMAALHQAIETMGEAGRAGAETLDDLGDTIGDAARSARREASYQADRSGESARIAARAAGKSISRSLAGWMK